MRLVFLNQYYPPDAAPTGVMLENLMEQLLRDGHEVSVLCATGGYAGRADRPRSADLSPAGREANDPAVSSRPQGQSGAAEAVRPYPPLRIIRIGATTFGRGTFFGKLLDYASYYLGVVWKLLAMNPAPQRIVALTTPPYLSVLARIMSRLRGADHAHWVMDLYPEVLAAHGMLGERGPAYRLLAVLARWGFGGKRCAALLTLGPDMAERVGRRVVRGPWSVVRDGNCEPRRGAQAPQTTDKRPPTAEFPVHWVPLWGGGGEKVIGDQSSGISEEQRLRIADRGSQIEEERLRGPATSSSSIPDHLSSSSDPPSAIHDPRSSIAALALRRARGWGDDDLVVMYSGNMGLGHRFGEILAAAKLLGGELRIADSGSQLEEERMRGAAASISSIHHPLSTISDPLSPIPDLRSTIHDPRSPAARQRLRFVFFGGGKRRDEVERFAREHPQAGVELYDYAPADNLMAHLQSADVHLASLDPAWTGTMVPSKVQGIFAAARPVVFIGNAQSSIGHWVLESGGGWVVAAGDVAGLLAALEAVRDPTVRETCGRGAKDFAAEHFDQDRNVARVVEILTNQQPRP